MVYRWLRNKGEKHKSIGFRDSVRKQQINIFCSLFWVSIIIWAIPVRAQDQVAQVNVSATPVRASISTPTPIPLPETFATVTPTWTPTPIGPVLLEVKESAGRVNVRTEPDPEAQRLGAIESGRTYSVVGRYFQWIQFQYDTSPTGTAWVYGELVDIVGEASEIPEVNLFTEPTVDTSVLDATLTWEVITVTPGGILTATANSRVLEVPTRIQGESLPEISDKPLPTFTYPPGIGTPMPVDGVTAIATPSSGVAQDIGETLPPIAPILLLGGLGILGLLLNALRR